MKAENWGETPDIDGLINQMIYNKSMQEIRSSNRRRGLWFHPSSLGKCVRETYFNMLSSYRGDKAVAPDNTLARVFSVGENMHRDYQDLFGRSGLLFGRYKCSHCRRIIVDEGFWPTKCPLCKRKSGVHFVETEMICYDPKISGKCDGIIIPDPEIPEAFIQEIKSISHWRFSSAPLTEHEHQVNFYIGMRPEIVVDEVTFHIKAGFILYENKNDQTRKIHWHPFDPVMFEDDMRSIKMIVRCVKRGHPPKRQPMFDKKHKKCKNWCPWSEECYGGKK